jgi:DNA-directed RNA polymerase subunit RPC12/RpoP
MNTENIYVCYTCGSKNTSDHGLVYDWIKPEALFECNKCFDARIDEAFLIMNDLLSLGGRFA